MGIPGSANPLLFGGAAVYEIEQSLRFNENDSTYLYSNIAATATDDQKYTLSFWIKRAFVGNDEYYFWCGPTSTTTGAIAIGFDAGYGTDELNLGMGLSGNPLQMARSNAAYRDPSAWMHVVVAVDSTQAAAGDIQKAWVNGEAVSWASQVNLNGYSFQYGGGNLIQLGAYMSSGGTRAYYSGSYIAEYHFIDGQQLDHTSFGEYDDNGVWRPINYSGTYGNVGFYLKFDPSATNGIGHDHSGNGNNFTPSGFTTSGTGTGYDVMNDTPTKNFATANPLAKRWSQSDTLNFGEGNLFVQTTNSSDATSRYAFSTQAISSGKFVFEGTLNTITTTAYIGIGNLDEMMQEDFSNVVQLVNNGDLLFPSSTTTGYSSSWSTGDHIRCEFDADTGDIQFFVNGTASTKTATSITGPFGAIVQCPRAASWYLNFGQQPWRGGTPTSGYNGWNTSDLPAPDIADGSQYFNTVLYTGNGTTQSITGVGFQPDFVWIKDRDSSTQGHHLFDGVRGAQKYLRSDATATEVTDSSSLTSFDSDGFSLGSNGAINNNLNATVAWNWLASNTSGSSNTAGSITSTVSANPTAGFSIVSYTGTGTAGTVGHGLGVAPSFIVAKNRDSTSNWDVYHTGLTSASYRVQLNSTGAQSVSNGSWNGTAPTSTVFSVKDDTATNSSSADHIAYCFAEVEGFSKFGSYTGNGSTDGPFVSLGFKPSFLVIKRSDSTESWLMFDSTRETYNPTDDVLWANLSNAESANYTPQDFLSNGFKIRTSSTSTNASGGTYIFMAFASSPFGGDGISPATAR